ncbi:MAG: hypothetical protein LOD91_04275, partial [Limnochordales bacterium]
GRTRRVIRGWIRSWTVTTTPMPLADAQALALALQSPAPLRCGGDLIGGTVDCYGSLTALRHQKTADGERAVVEFRLVEAAASSPVGVLLSARRGLPAGATFSRGSTAWTLLPDGTLAEVAANVPRIAWLDLDGDGYGDLMGCEVGWTCHDQIEYKLQAYGLDRLYRQIDASEQMINIAVQSALDNREPVLFMAWTPDWLLAAYPYPEVVTFLRDPVGAWPGAEDEPRNEFGYPPGRAGILVHRDFQRRHPEAYRLMSQISVPLEAVNESVYRQVVLGETSAADLERHAREWIDANRETVDGWLAAAGLR